MTAGEGLPREQAEILLRTFDALEAAMVAESLEAAIAEVRGDLEVLPPEQLLLVATALAVEPARRLMAPVEVVRLRERVQRARLQVMWQASS